MLAEAEKALPHGRLVRMGNPYKLRSINRRGKANETAVGRDYDSDLARCYSPDLVEHGDLSLAKILGGWGTK